MEELTLFDYITRAPADLAKYPDFNAGLYPHIGELLDLKSSQLETLQWTIA